MRRRTRLRQAASTQSSLPTATETTLGNTIEIARATGAVVYANYEVSLYLKKAGAIHVEGMNKSGSVRHDGVEATMVDATHSSGIETGEWMLAGGDPAGYVFRFREGASIYHAGDTVVFGDMKLIAELYKPQLAILPIGMKPVILPMSFSPPLPGGKRTAPTPIPKDGYNTSAGPFLHRGRHSLTWEIITRLALKMGAGWHYTGPREIMQEINATTPSYGGITYDRIEHLGLQWPCPTLEHPGTPILHKDAFTRGKGLFSAIEYTPPAEVPDAEYPYILTTGRILYQYHTASMTGRCEGLQFRYPQGHVEIHERDARVQAILRSEIGIINLFGLWTLNWIPWR